MDLFHFFFFFSGRGNTLLIVGFFGTASTSEALFGCLEYLPVILALIIWAIFPPSSFLEKVRGRGVSGVAGGETGSQGDMLEVKESRKARKAREKREAEERIEQGEQV